MYVIGAGDCGQLGVGEDDVEALRARLSSVASGVKVRTGLSVRPVQAERIIHSTVTVLGLLATLL